MVINKMTICGSILKSIKCQATTGKCWCPNSYGNTQMKVLGLISFILGSVFKVLKNVSVTQRLGWDGYYFLPGVGRQYYDFCLLWLICPYFSELFPHWPQPVHSNSVTSYQWERCLPLFLMFPSCRWNSINITQISLLSFIHSALRKQSKLSE